METKCLGCGQSFGENRRFNIQHFTSPFTQAKCLIRPGKGFLCELCLGRLRRLTVPAGKGKKRYRRKWPVIEEEDDEDYENEDPLDGGGDQTQPEGEGFKEQVKRHIDQSHYHAAVHLLVQESAAARTAVLEVAAKEIANEMKKLGTDGSGDVSSLGKFTEQSMKSFSWEKVQNQVQEALPAWDRCLKAAMGAERDSEGAQCPGGLVSAIVLHQRYPRKYAFLQACMSVELWRQGATQKLFRSLNHLGVSLGVKSAWAHVDQLAQNHDKKLKMWKEKVQEKAKSPPGFVLCFDNVQITSHTKHQGQSDSPNNFLIWALGFAAENRVPTQHLQAQNRTVAAASLGPEAFLPDRTDTEDLRRRMTALVMRCVADYLPLNDVEKFVERHVSHEFSYEMRQKSEIVNCGITECNPSTIDGTIKVMLKMQSYVPEVDGKLEPVVCLGDGLSADLMNRAKKAVANCPQTDGMCRLSGLVEGPEEFHKEALLAQDMMKTFFDGASQTESATLANIKEVFNHRSLKAKVMANFQHAWDFLKFVTYSYVIVLALTLCGAKLDEVPSHYPKEGSNDEKLQWLRNLSNQIVQVLWQPYPSNDVSAALTAYLHECDIDADDDEIPIDCICNEEKDDVLLTCGNSNCNMRYHKSCAGANPRYCSDHCRETGNCHCHEKIEGATTIECAAKDKCHLNRFYHRQCVNNFSESDMWYCSTECSLNLPNCPSDDGILNYSRAVTWNGLNLLVRRDAVREGDGPAIVSHWKHDMLQFWDRNHSMYFRIGHQFLANVAGCAPTRIRRDLIWNRLANLHGRPGGNVGLDLVNEFLNNDYKEMLKRSRGVYTDKQTARCAELSGAYGKTLDDILAATTCHQDSGYRYRASDPALSTVHKFVTQYSNEGLFSYVPNRNHRSFKGKSFQTSLRNPVKLAGKLRALSSNMDVWRDIFSEQDF